MAEKQSIRKVTFSGHILNYDDERVLQVHNPNDSQLNISTNDSHKTKRQRKKQPNETIQQRNETLNFNTPAPPPNESQNTPNFDMNQNKSNSFMLHNYSFPQPYSSNAFDINALTTPDVNADKKTYNNFVGPSPNNTKPLPYYFMLHQHQAAKVQQLFNEKNPQNYREERHEAKASEVTEKNEESDATEKDLVDDGQSDTDTDYIPSDSDSEENEKQNGN